MGGGIHKCLYLLILKEYKQEVTKIRAKHH